MSNNTPRCKAVLLNPPTAAPSSEILLNLAYLSSSLKHAGHDVMVLDATAPYNSLSEEEIERRILDFKPHFIGVTLTITYIPQTYDYLRRLGQLKIPIIAGGPHANCLPDEVLQHGIDIVAIGEGEDTILELADYSLGNKKLEDIAGVCFKNENRKHHYTPIRSPIKDLDRIPFPDYDSFPIVYYTASQAPDSNPIFWSLFSSRGCPYNCIFCASHNVFGRTYRSRSPHNIFEEIKCLTEKYGTKRFAFQDDEAFIDKERVEVFCDLIKKNMPSLQFSGRLRIDNLDEDMLRAMSSAGFRRLAFGVESFNNESLLKMNKKYDVETVFKGFKILEKVGFPVVYFNNLVGFPWETPEHLKNNLEEISKIPKSLVYFTSTSTLIPYPGTPLYEQYHEQYGFTDWWLDPAKNSPPSNASSKDVFFSMFMFDKMPLLSDDIFWNHSPEMSKAIQDFCWKVSSMSLKRYLSFSEYHFAFKLSRLSHWIWKRSPRLERVIFRPLVRLAKRLGLDQKARFANW